MKPRTQVVLLATLMSASAWGQEVSLYGTTLAQQWKQDAPGFDKATFTPATQYLGIDATKVGSENLSLHLFGWGRTDLGEATSPDGKRGGSLTFGYARYRFDQANAEIKAGRFFVTQGGTIESVDGLAARADLRGGFTVSAFAGKPVLFRTVDPQDRPDYEFQRDFIFGTRFAWRSAKVGEFGLSYLQDGTKAAKDLTFPSPVDYTRKQLGGDIRITPTAFVDFSGRTVLDLANRDSVLAPTAPKPSKIAEHDYTLTVKVADLFIVTGNMTERNYQAYYAGSNFRSLFRQDERGKYKGWAGSVAWGQGGPVQVTADYRHTDREIYGAANRVGANVRWTILESKLVSGFGYHNVSAADAVLVDGRIPTYGLSYREARAWVMYTNEKFTASLDGIQHAFSDRNNPNLNGQSSEYEFVGSLGYQVLQNMKISGDLSHGSNPFYKKETRGLLRAEFRFGKGGR